MCKAQNISKANCQLAQLHYWTACNSEKYFYVWTLSNNKLEHEQAEKQLKVYTSIDKNSVKCCFFLVYMHFLSFVLIVFATRLVSCTIIVHEIVQHFQGRPLEQQRSMSFRQFTLNNLLSFKNVVMVTEERFI